MFEKKKCLTIKYFHQKILFKKKISLKKNPLKKKIYMQEENKFVAKVLDF